MIGRTNAGGVGGKPFAVIGVTYPAGSTCTCTNGSKTLRAKDTTGKALFVIPSAGTWTVTITNGSKTKSKAVEITAEGQTENVTLTYELVLFEDGAYQNIGSFSQAEIINGNLRMYGSGGSGMSEVYKTFITDIKLDLTNYKTLTFSLAEFEIWDNTYPGTRNTRFGVCSNTIGNVHPSAANIAAETTLSIGNNGTDITVTVDVSALTGEYYVFVSENIYGSITVLAKSIIIN